MTVGYLQGNKITRRILEFPPVETDEDLENFQKLIGKMWVTMQPYLRNKIGKKIDDQLLYEFELMFPFAYFYNYGNGCIGINFKQDYLDERNLCIDGYGKIQRKP